MNKLRLIRTTCRECKHKYFVQESLAEDIDLFCSSECETNWHLSDELS